MTQNPIRALLTFEPAHDKTFNKTYVIGKDQPVRPPSVARILVYSSLNSLEAVEDIRSAKTDQCAEAHANLSPRRSHKSYCSIVR